MIIVASGKSCSPMRETTAAIKEMSPSSNEDNKACTLKLLVSNLGGYSNMPDMSAVGRDCYIPNVSSAPLNDNLRTLMMNLMLFLQDVQGGY